MEVDLEDRDLEISYKEEESLRERRNHDICSFRSTVSGGLGRDKRDLIV